MEGCECTEAPGRHAQVSRLDNCNRLGRGRVGETGQLVNTAIRRENGLLEVRLSAGEGDGFPSAADIGA